MTKIIPVSPSYFFTEVVKEKSVDVGYKEKWISKELSFSSKVEDFLSTNSEFSEFEVIYKTLNQLPDNSILHLANSMPVRYANYIGLKNKSIEVIANRGTSGIDGVISTAYGTALTTDKIVTVITGDMTFLYDRNAFWNNYLPKNLRIVILNNHGGGIFRMIEGPSSQAEGEEYFVTKQNLTAENSLKDYNVEYSFSKDRKSFEELLLNFFDSNNQSKILEIETDGLINTALWKAFKASI